MSATTDLENGRVGRGPVVVGLKGLTLSAEERERLAHPLVGGVALFSRNFESVEQLKALTQAIRSLQRAPLLICVDQEGGRVQRFREGFTRLPPMREIGDLWKTDRWVACRRATEVGRIIARELCAVGVHLSLTPVLDLDWGRSSVIGDRAFSRDPTVVATLGLCLMQGLLLEGMAHCGKHFPGHGFAQADTHVAAKSVDDRPLAEILSLDAAPYGWLRETLLSVMVAHVVYSEVDTQPAGFSSRWLKDILRGTLGFDGLIFSDDLGMEAAAVAGDMPSRANTALRAGCDMVLVCDSPAVDTVLDGLQWSPDLHFRRRLQALFR